MAPKPVVRRKKQPKREPRGNLVPVTVGMPLALIELLDVAAERERRSRTNLIDVWLSERLEQEGYSVRGGAA
jgi:hypothetical protein